MFSSQSQVSSLAELEIKIQLNLSTVTTSGTERGEKYIKQTIDCKADHIPCRSYVGSVYRMGSLAVSGFSVI